MRSDFAINPFDTQLGNRYPTPQERAFLVNFLSLLATPIGSDKSYDGVPDMSGLIIDELFKNKADDGNPNVYATGIEDNIDGILEEIGFIQDAQTTWWEVTDALFMAGFTHEAMLTTTRHASISRCCLHLPIACYTRPVWKNHGPHWGTINPCICPHDF